MLSQLCVLCITLVVNGFDAKGFFWFLGLAWWHRLLQQNIFLPYGQEIVLVSQKEADTKDRMVYKELHFSSATAFDPQRPNWPLTGSTNIAKFRIMSVSFPCTFYSVDQNSNTIVLREKGSTYNANLPIGNYTADMAPQTVQDALNAVSPTKGYIVNYNHPTRNLTIQNSNVQDFSLGTSLAGSTAYLTVGLPGYGAYLQATNGSLNTQVCQFSNTVPLLLSSRTLYSTGCSYGGRDDLNVLCQIPPAESGSVVCYEPQGGSLDFSGDISAIDFTLLKASDLQPIDLNGGILSVSLCVLTDVDDVPQY